MKRVAIAGLVLAGACLGAAAQVESDGTIVVADWTQDEIVIAADSRESTADSYSDRKCKIAAFGDKLIFAAAGRRGTRNKITRASLWDSFAIARQQFAKLADKGATDRLAKRLADAWGQSVKEQVERYGALSLSGLDDHTVTRGIFADFEKDGSLLIVVETVAYEIVGGQTTITASPQIVPPLPATVYYLGRGEILNELRASQTPRSIKWNHDIDRLMVTSRDQAADEAIAYVDLTIVNFPKTKTDSRGVPFSIMGQPIAVVQLRRGKGVEWIKQGNCESK